METNYLELRLDDFLARIAASNESPGGGSAAAFTVAVAAGLVAMAARCSHGSWQDGPGVAAQGQVEIAPRRRLPLREGALADMAASDLGLGLAGAKVYAATAEGVSFVVSLFDGVSSALVAVLEADELGRLRTGAASAVAARHLARSGARALGIIGCGSQAETQVSCIRAAVPGISEVVAYCRTPGRLTAEGRGGPGRTIRSLGTFNKCVPSFGSRMPIR